MLRTLTLTTVAAALLAGCGSTTVVRHVRDRPCATPARMTRCVADIARYAARSRGLKPGIVRARCDHEGQIWSCLVLAPSVAGGDQCGRVLVEVTGGVGIPYPGGGEMKPLAECEKAFGSA